MNLNPKIAALTAINEAISAMNFIPREYISGEVDFYEALELLMAEREHLTDKYWPNEPAKQFDEPAFEAWHAEHAALQRRDGRQ